MSVKIKPKSTETKPNLCPLSVAAILAKNGYEDYSEHNLYTFCACNSDCEWYSEGECVMKEIGRALRTMQ